MGDAKYWGSKSMINASLNACDSELCPSDQQYAKMPNCQGSSLGWPVEYDLKLGWARRRLSLGFGLPASKRRVGYLLVESFLNNHHPYPAIEIRKKVSTKSP